MKKVKLGIIGTGIAARILHWPALKQLQNKIEIVQVCNHTKKKAKDFAKLVGGVPYTVNYKEILNNPDVGAVDIMLPIELNHKVVKEALDAGKHVIMEKPIAVNLKEAKKMLKYPAMYKKQVMMIAENFRYRNVYQKAKSLLNQKVIGKPYFIKWNVCYNVDNKNEYAQTKWRINHKYDGGFVTDCGVHNIAAIRLLTGDIKSGAAFTHSVNPRIGKIDTFSLQFETDKNIKGMFNMFFSVRGHYEDRILIHGSSGTIEIWEDKIYVKKEGREPKFIDCSADLGFYLIEYLVDPAGAGFLGAIRRQCLIFSLCNLGFVFFVIETDRFVCD